MKHTMRWTAGWLCIFLLLGLCSCVQAPATTPGTEPQLPETFDVDRTKSDDGNSYYFTESILIDDALWGPTYRNSRTFLEDGTVRIKGAAGGVASFFSEDAHNKMVDINVQYNGSALLINLRHDSESNGCGGGDGYTFIITLPATDKANFTVCRFNKGVRTDISSATDVDWNREAFHNLRVGALDTEDGNVRLVMESDGKVIIDALDDTAKKLTKPGYVFFQSGEAFLMKQVNVDSGDFAPKFLSADKVAGFNKLSEADKAAALAVEPGTPYVPDVTYENGEISVAIANVVQFGAVGDGVTDDLNAFRKALSLASSRGGGTVFVPDGVYYFSRPLFVPSNVTLRGTYQSPETTKPGTGSVIVTDYAATGILADPLIMMASSSGVRNLAFYYVDQSFTDPVDLAPCIGMDNGNTSCLTVENVMIYNAANALGFSGVHNGTHILTNIWATPLKVGFISDESSDINRLTNITFSASYWESCAGLYGAPSSDADKAALRASLQQAVGFIIERNDAMQGYGFYTDGIGTGLIMRSTSNPNNTSWAGYGGGTFYNFEFKDCHTGIKLEGVTYAGATFTNGKVEIRSGKDTVGLHATRKFTMNCFFNGLEISGNPENAVLMEGTGNLGLVNCRFENWSDEGFGFAGNSGQTYFHQCTFVKKGNEINAGRTRMLSVLGCSFATDAPVINTDKVVVGAKIDHRPLNIDPAPTAEYDFIDKIPGAAKKDIFNVAQYGAMMSGRKDVTEAINKALQDAADNGGGIVYMPAGIYRINGTLNVPTGVELRGAVEIAGTTLNYSGTLLHVYGGEGNADGDGAVVLAPGAGVRGVNFYYPTQETNENYKAFPYAIRATGQNCWAIDCIAINAYQIADFGTAEDTSGFYVYAMHGQSLKTGVFVGNNSGTGRLENCHFACSEWCYSAVIPNKPVLTPGAYDARDYGTNDSWTLYLLSLMEHNNYFVVGANENLLMFGNGGFGSNSSIVFIEQNGKNAKNAEVYMHYVDASRRGFIVESAGTVNVYNGHICCVCSDKPHAYIEMLADCGATVTLHGTSSHGHKDTGYIVNGGTLTINLASLYNPGSVMVDISGGTANMNAIYAHENVILVKSSGGTANLNGMVVYTANAAPGESGYRVQGTGEININNCSSTDKLPA